MLCENCYKREAMVKFTQVIGSDKKTVNLCRECAESQGMNTPLADISKVFGKIIVAILSEHLEAMSQVTESQVEQTACDACGLTWNDFEKTGRLGCPHCYEKHIDQLKTLLRRLHGSNKHIGKSAQYPEDNKVSIEKLRKMLQKAVEKEAYEEAAQLRDRIRLIEKRGGTSPSRKT